MTDKGELDARVQAIKARFPYQFEDCESEVLVGVGWTDVFAKLCADVDQLLGADKHGFHWSPVKEKFGSASFQFQLGAGNYDALSVFRSLRKLTTEAERKTQNLCAVCGHPGELDRSQPWVLVVCPEHKILRMELGQAGRRLDGFWLKFN